MSGMCVATYSYFFYPDPYTLFAAHLYNLLMKAQVKAYGYIQPCYTNVTATRIVQQWKAICHVQFQYNKLGVYTRRFTASHIHVVQGRVFTAK